MKKQYKHQISAVSSSAQPGRLGCRLSLRDSCQVRPLRFDPETDPTRGWNRGHPRTKYSRMPLFSKRKIAHNFYSLYEANTICMSSSHFVHAFYPSTRRNEIYHLRYASLDDFEIFSLVCHFSTSISEI